MAKRQKGAPVDTSVFHIPDPTDLESGILMNVPEGDRSKLIVMRYDKETMTKGGIVKPEQYRTSPECLAFVVKSGTWPIAVGDTILVSQRMLHEGSNISPLDPDLNRAFCINTSDVLLLYPDPTNPLENRPRPPQLETEDEHMRQLVRGVVLEVLGEQQGG